MKVFTITAVVCIGVSTAGFAQVNYDSARVKELAMGMDQTAEEMIAEATAVGLDKPIAVSMTIKLAKEIEQAVAAGMAEAVTAGDIESWTEAIDREKATKIVETGTMVLAKAMTDGVVEAANGTMITEMKAAAMIDRTTAAMIVGAKAAGVDVATAAMFYEMMTVMTEAGVELLTRAATEGMTKEVSEACRSLHETDLVACLKRRGVIIDYRDTSHNGSTPLLEKLDLKTLNIALKRPFGVWTPHPFVRAMEQYRFGEALRLNSQNVVR